MFTFRKIRSSDKDLMQVQDNVNNVFSTLGLLQILDGTLIRNVALVANSNIINHGLDRQPLGWIIVDRDSSATIYRTAWDARTLTLYSSSTGNISLWVF